MDSAINKSMPGPHVKSATVSSTTTASCQQKKAEQREGSSRRVRRSRGVRDVRKLCALKGACTVSRGGGRSNVASLPALVLSDGDRYSQYLMKRPSMSSSKTVNWEQVKKSRRWRGGDMSQTWHEE